MGMKKKRVLSIVLAIAMCLTAFGAAPMMASAAPTFSGGTGTESDPWQIGTAADLADLATAVNDGTFNTEGQYFRATEALDLAAYGSGQSFNGGKGWIPIGTYAQPFKGHFDGNNLEISNLFIDDGVRDNVGLFGKVVGTLRNIRLVGIDVRGGSFYIGGLAGILDSALPNSVKDCSVTGEIKAEGGVNGQGVPHGGYYVGGLIGFILNGTVKNCYTECDMPTNAQYIGGIAGSLEIHPGKTGSIEDCYSIGTVKGDSRVGGIVGAVWNAEIILNPDGTFNTANPGVSATVTRCYAKGSVISVHDIVGGIAGEAAYGGRVEYCFAWNDTFTWGGGDFGGRVTGSVYAVAPYEGLSENNYAYEGTVVNYSFSDTNNSPEAENDNAKVVFPDDDDDVIKETIKDLFPENEGWDTDFPPVFPQANAPEVTEVIPVAGATNIDIAGFIVITFSNVMDENSPGTVVISGAALNAASAFWSTDFKTYTIPYDGLAYDTLYTITIAGFKDVDRSAMAASYTSTFTTRTEPVVELDKPTVTVTPLTDLPASGTLTLTFSKSMNTSLGTVLLDGKTLTGTWLNNTTFVVNYADLVAGRTYPLTLNDFAAADGALLDPPGIQVTVRAAVDTEGLPSCKITFDAAGGGKVTVTVDLKTGAVYGKLPVPTRKGFTFAGWFTAPTGGTAVTESTTFTGTTNQTLYASWKPNVYTIKFHVNRGESIKTKSKKVTFGSKVGTLPKPVPRRLGYKFLGWYTTKAGGKKYTAKTTYAKAGNTVLFAHWTVLYNRAIPKLGYAKVAIRTKADSTSKVLGYYKKGEVFTVIKKHLRKDGSCDYLQVKYKGKTAWVRSYHVKTFKVYAKQ